VAPAKAGEAAEVPVCRDPFVPGLDRERSQVCVEDEVALRPGRQAEPLEGRPVARAGRDYHGVRLRPERVDERECLLGRRGRIEYPRMRGDADNSGEDQLG